MFSELELSTHNFILPLFRGGNDVVELCLNKLVFLAFSERVADPTVACRILICLSFDVNMFPRNK